MLPNRYDSGCGRCGTPFYGKSWADMNRQLSLHLWLRHPLVALRFHWERALPRWYRRIVLARRFKVKNEWEAR